MMKHIIILFHFNSLLVVKSMKAWQHDVLLLFEIAERKSERIIVKVLMNEEVLGGLKFFEEN